MADKPTKVPRWNTNLTNNTEPAEAKKDTGWVFQEDPSSAFFNFLMNLAGAWLTWLNDRVTNVGGTAPRIGLRGIGTIGETGGTGITAVGDAAAAGVVGTGGATSGAGVTGTGGAPNGKGGTFAGTGTGTGVDSTGGATSGAGVTALGGAPNGRGVSSTGDGTGAGVFSTGGDSDGVGLDGVGGAANGIGVRGAGTGTGDGLVGTGGATNGRGALGTGTGTGTGVRGVGGATGYGVEAEADTTTPVRSAMRIVPQDADPSTAAKGDVIVHSSENALKFHDGTQWVRSNGWELIKKAQLGSDAPTFSSGTFTPRRSINVIIRGTGFTTDVKPRMKFHPTEGPASYAYRHLTSAQNTNTLVNNQAGSTAFIELMETFGGGDWALDMVGTGLLSANKVFTWRFANRPTIIASNGLVLGIGEFVFGSSTFEILLSLSGAGNISAGTDIWVYGRD